MDFSQIPSIFTHSYKQIRKKSDFFVESLAQFKYLSYLCMLFCIKQNIINK